VDKTKLNSDRSLFPFPTARCQRNLDSNISLARHRPDVRTGGHANHHREYHHSAKKASPTRATGKSSPFPSSSGGVPTPLYRLKPPNLRRTSDAVRHQQLAAPGSIDRNCKCVFGNKFHRLHRRGGCSSPLNHEYRSHLSIFREEHR